MAAVAPFTEEEMLHVRMAQMSFPYFLEHIYPRSFDGQLFRYANGVKRPFELGRIHYLWAQMAQQHPRLCIMAPRLHLKSTVLNQAYCFWRMFSEGQDIDGIVFGFKEDRAWEHLAKLKSQIRKNPYCRYWVDLKPRTDKPHFKVDFGAGHIWVATVDAAGILTAQRGRHPRFVVCDDILKDFSSPMDSPEMKHIDIIFRQVIGSMPDLDDSLLVVGTPQSYEDTLFQLKKNDEYFWGRFPAELALGGKMALWPEKYDYARLQRVRRTVKEQAYQVEYLLVPYLATAAYIPQEAWELCVDPDLRPYSLTAAFHNPHHFPVYFGMDVGKEVHPSHISVAIQGPDRTLVQIYEKFIEHTPYNEQTTLVNKLFSHFGIDRGYYDATRAELVDRGLTKRLKGVKITKQLKGRVALILNKRVYAGTDEPGLVLLPNPKQIRSLVAVDKELQATETDNGHGDAFWSNGLMCAAADDGPGVSILSGSVNDWMSASGRPDARGMPR